MEEMGLTNSFTPIAQQQFLLPVLFLHARAQSQVSIAASINRLTIFPIIQEIEAVVASGNGSILQHERSRVFVYRHPI
jgi:hypothetical protein